MELANEFDVPVPVDEAFRLLTDLERIAPCMPGATLTSVEGDEFHGNVKVKVGPVTTQFKGTAKIAERDETAHTAVLEAKGRDTKGQGNASATIRAELKSSGTNSTTVSLVTDLNISGKVAQFGRSAMADISTKLLGQFADNVKRDLVGAADTTPPAQTTPADIATSKTQAVSEPAVEAPEGSSAAPVAPKPAAATPPREAEPIDLLATAGSPILKQVLPAIAGIGLAVVVIWVWRHRPCRHRKR